MERIPAWIACVGLAIALLGHYVLHDWRVTTVGGGLTLVAVGALIINSEGKGNGK